MQATCVCQVAVRGTSAVCARVRSDMGAECGPSLPCRVCVAALFCDVLGRAHAGAVPLRRNSGFDPKRKIGSDVGETVQERARDAAHLLAHASKVRGRVSVVSRRSLGVTSVTPVSLPSLQPCPPCPKQCPPCFPTLACFRCPALGGPFARRSA